MVYIERPDDFIAEITKLYEKNKEKGSVWVTIKKYTPIEPKPKSENQKKFSKEAADKKTQDKKDSKKTQPQKKKKSGKLAKEGCIIRATDGDVKISTIIIQKEVARFQAFLFNICSQNFRLKRKMAEEKKKQEEEASKVQKVQPNTTASSHAKEVQQKKKKTM